MVIEGTIIGFLASIPLGPIGVICIRRTLNGTRNTGFVSGLGAATADTIFALLAVFAVSYVTSFLEGKEIWINTIGGILVMILGFSIFMKRVDTSRGMVNNQESGSTNLARNYLSILLLTITNPTYFFVFMSLFSAAGIDVTTNTIGNNLFLIMGIAIGTSGWWFVLTWIINKIRQRFTMRSLWWLNKISGAVIIVLGAGAIISMLFTLTDIL